MQIHQAGYVPSLHTATAAHRGASLPPAAETSGLAAVDTLEISAAGELASRALDGMSSGQLGRTELGRTELGRTELGRTELGRTELGRGERIEQIRAAIQAGTYETEQRLSAAVDRLLDELG
jgi:hypothetical protein